MSNTENAVYIHNVANEIWPVGPSLPVTIHKTLAAREHHGKADPIWDVQFRTKITKSPVKTELATPKGTLNVIQRFEADAAELDYLINTQHLELATTHQLLKANGIESMSLSQSFSEDYDKTDITDSMLQQAEVAIDPTYKANQMRRIEWERYIFACGPIHKARFAPTKDGVLGIDYDGPTKFRGTEIATDTRRALKYGWLDRVGPLPTCEELAEMRAFAANYHGKVVLARMTDAEWNADTNSRRYGDEDRDPGRNEFHALNPRTAAWEPCFDEETGDPDGMMTADLPGGIADVGYAGPSGFLGLDDDAKLDDEFEYFADTAN